MGSVLHCSDLFKFFLSTLAQHKEKLHFWNHITFTSGLALEDMPVLYYLQLPEFHQCQVNLPIMVCSSRPSAFPSAGGKNKDAQPRVGTHLLLCTRFTDKKRASQTSTSNVIINTQVTYLTSSWQRVLTTHVLLRNTSLRTTRKNNSGPGPGFDYWPLHFLVPLPIIWR